MIDDNRCQFLKLIDIGYQWTIDRASFCDFRLSLVISDIDKAIRVDQLLNNIDFHRLPILIDHFCHYRFLFD